MRPLEGKFKRNKPILKGINEYPDSIELFICKTCEKPFRDKIGGNTTTMVCYACEPRKK